MTAVIHHTSRPDHLRRVIATRRALGIRTIDDWRLLNVALSSHDEARANHSSFQLPRSLPPRHALPHPRVVEAGARATTSETL